MNIFLYIYNFKDWNRFDVNINLKLDLICIKFFVCDKLGYWGRIFINN